MSRVLVVEDNPDNMKLFRALLTKRGHELIELTTGSELLEAVSRNHPDLVLLDIQLPDKDGYTLLAELRRSSVGPVRVIALTAHAGPGDRERALSAGFYGYLTKPIYIRRFPDQIAQAIAGQPWES